MSNVPEKNLSVAADAGESRIVLRDCDVENFVAMSRIGLYEASWSASSSPGLSQLLNIVDGCFQRVEKPYGAVRSAGKYLEEKLAYEDSALL